MVRRWQLTDRFVSQGRLCVVYNRKIRCPQKFCEHGCDLAKGRVDGDLEV
jgi:hypothetical protein